MMVCNPIDQTDQLFISYFLNTTFRHILHKYSNEDVSFVLWSARRMNVEPGTNVPEHGHHRSGAEGPDLVSYQFV